MKKLFVFILPIAFSLFSQKSTLDPYAKWKTYKKLVDKNVSDKKYVFKKNIKMMCHSFHGIHIYSKKDTIILIEGIMGHMCGHGGMDFYYKDQKLMLVKVYDKITATDSYCKDFSSTSKDYYIENERLLNYKKIKEEDGDATAYYAWIKEREFKMLEEIKEENNCLDK